MRAFDLVVSSAIKIKKGRLGGSWKLSRGSRE